MLEEETKNSWDQTSEKGYSLVSSVVFDMMKLVLRLLEGEKSWRLGTDSHYQGKEPWLEHCWQEAQAHAKGHLLSLLLMFSSFLRSPINGTQQGASW